MYHQPALLRESIEGLLINPDGIYVDLTYGGGGHSCEILKNLGKNSRLIAFDRDPDALNNTINDERFTLLNENFRYFINFLRYYGALPVDGILADLGVSFFQFDTPERGFSTRFDGPLDMRMDTTQPATAAMLVNSYSRESLVEIFRNYGEIENAHQLADCIVAARQTPIRTTRELIEAVKPCTPRGIENKYLAQLFQAIRIEINDEMPALRSMLKSSLQALKPGGRLAVIAYHSLEDRQVKNFMKTGNLEGILEKDFFGKSLTPFKAITRKPLTPGPEELAQNPRSRSAKLRIAEKI